MPTINKPFLLKIILVVVAFAGLLVGANALQSRRIPEALLAQTDRAVEAKDLGAAIKYLRQYIEFCPDDLDSLVRLAELLEERDVNSRRPSELFYLHDKILREDPSREGIRRSALKLCLRMRRYSDAVPHAEMLLKTHPADATLWQQLAAGQAGMNKLPEARKSYEEAVRHAPDQPLGYQRLAQFVWKNQHDIPGAREVLNRLIAALPMDPESHLARARFESFVAAGSEADSGAKGDLDRAVADLQRALELDPENADAVHLLAEILQKGRNVPAAHALLREGVALYPSDLRMIRSLSWLELVRGNVPAAIGVLEEGLRHVPEGFDLLIPLADLLVQQGNTVRTEEIVQRLSQRKAPAIQLQYLNARLAMKQGRWAEAQTMLETLRNQAVNMPGLEIQLNQLLASCYQRVGDIASEEKALKRVTDVDPVNVNARVALGMMMMNQGKFDDAIREYEAACQSQYAAGSVFAQMIRLHTRRLVALGGKPEDWKRVEQAAEKCARRFSPVESEPVILRAEVAIAQGKRVEAVKMLRSEASRRPGDAKLWSYLASVAADVGGTAEGLAILDEAQAACGDGPEVRLARALLYTRDPARVRPIEPLGERLEAWPDFDQVRLFAGLIEVHDRIGDAAGVIRNIKLLAARRSTDVSLWLRLFERAHAAGDAKSAAEARAALVKIEGEQGQSVLICDGLAASDGDAARQIERLQAAMGLNPDRADACLALSRLHETAGNRPAALRLAERALLLEASRFETNRAILLLRLREGKRDLATRDLQRLAVDPRWTGEPYRRLVAMIADELPPPDAVAVLEMTPAFIREEAGATGWLAEHYAKAGAKEKAHAATIAATRSRAANADDWLRLALHEAANGNADAAKEALDACRSKLSPPAFFALAAAFAETPHAKLWQPKRSTPVENRAYAQARLAIKLSKSVPAEAIGVMEEFLDAKGQPDSDLAWARRNLAMLLVIGGRGAEDRQRALTLLAEAEAVAATRPEELRATAAVLTTLCRYLEGADRANILAKAASCLKSAAKSGAPRDVFNLAQLYRVAGKTKESRDCLNQLLQSDPDNLYYLVTALDMLLEAEEYATAAGFAERLRLRHGGEFRAVAAVARYEAKSGRAERSLVLAEEYVRAAGPGAGDFLSRSARVAELLDELARLPKVRGTEVGRRMTQAAVERYGALVPTRSEAAVAIASLLAADNRPAEAFSRLEQFQLYLSARTRLLAGLGILRSGNANELQFGIVRGWLDSCIAEEGDSLVLKLSEAEYFSLKQDLPKAEAAYRAVLERDPRNVTALNNLAWSLATEPKSSKEAETLVTQAMRDLGVTGELLDTRARIRITARQFEKAENDLNEALKHGRTPLRLFHLAVLRMTETPPRPDEAKKHFLEARDRGLEARGIHPADLPIFRVLATPAGTAQR